MKRVKHDRETGDEHHHKTPGFGVLGEKHYVDCYKSATAIQDNGTTWVAANRFDPTSTVNMGAGAIATPLNLCSPPSGSELDQRIGRAIKICKVTVRFELEYQGDSEAATIPGMTVRALLVLDKQTNGAQLTAAEVMNGGAAGYECLASFTNPNGFGRFEILRDKLVALNYHTLTFSANRITAGFKKVFVLKYKWPQGLLVHFNATAGGTVTSVITNSLHVLAGQSNSSTWNTRLSYTSRVEFYNVDPYLTDFATE